MSAPRVVVVRPREVEADSRGKKFALSLARLGYDVTLVCAAEAGQSERAMSLGPVCVRPVGVTSEHRDELMSRMVRRRTRTYPIFSRLSADEAAARIESWTKANDAGGSRWRVARIDALRWRSGMQTRVNGVTRVLWTRWSDWSRRRTLGATVAGMVPEVVDFDAAFGPVLRELDADVLHVHHPFLLPLACRVARDGSRAQRRVHVVYDAREFFAGLPPVEQGNRRRQSVLLKLEAEISKADGVVTVSDPIAQALGDRYRLQQRPAVVLNLPVFRASTPSVSASVRADLGLAADVPLIVYSGGINRSRGLDTLMQAMPELPGVHLAVVTVPYPHPQLPALLEFAGTSADRVHELPPVTQDDLIAYLASADVGVHPMPGGSPNHDMALPNKLFEYVHAGLTLVVSDAREMASFVTDNDLGTVFASNDAHSLAAAITQALKQAKSRDPEAATKRAERFSWQSQESVIAVLYEQVAPVTGSQRPVSLPVAFPPLDVRATATV